MLRADVRAAAQSLIGRPWWMLTRPSAQEAVPWVKGKPRRRRDGWSYAHGLRRARYRRIHHRAMRDTRLVAPPPMPAPPALTNRRQSARERRRAQPGRRD